MFPFSSLFGGGARKGRPGFQEAFIDDDEGAGNHHQQQQHRQPIKQQQQRRGAGGGGSYTPPGQVHEPARANPHQQQQQRPAAAPRGAAGPRPQPPRLSPDAAATRIQASWRAARVGRHRAAIKDLARCAEHLRAIAAKEHALLREQAGQPLTQKQFLELSETVMKVLFDLDAVSCGPVLELRAKRKQLTTAANALLDEIQAAHKSAGGAAAALAKAAAAGAGPHGVQPAAGPQPHGVKKAGKDGSRKR